MARTSTLAWPGGGAGAAAGCARRGPRRASAATSAETRARSSARARRSPRGAVARASLQPDGGRGAAILPVGGRRAPRARRDRRGRSAAVAGCSWRRRAEHLLERGVEDREVLATRAQRRAQRVVGLARDPTASTAASARCAVSSSPRPTRTPSRRIAAASAARAGAAAQTPSSQPRGPHALDVLAHLQHREQRGVELVGVEREQRLRPGDRLADARPLVELLLAQQRDRAAHAVDHRCGRLRDARRDDLELAVDRG